MGFKKNGTVSRADCSLECPLVELPLYSVSWLLYNPSQANEGNLLQPLIKLTSFWGKGVKIARLSRTI